MIQHCVCVFLFVEVCQVYVDRRTDFLVALSLSPKGSSASVNREECNLTWAQFLHFVCTKDGAGHSSCTFLYTLTTFHNTFVCIDINVCL